MTENEIFKNIETAIYDFKKLTAKYPHFLIVSDDLFYTMRKASSGSKVTLVYINDSWFYNDLQVLAVREPGRGYLVDFVRVS